MPDLKKFMDNLDQKVTDIFGMVKVLEDDDIPSPRERYEPHFGPRRSGNILFHKPSNVRHPVYRDWSFLKRHVTSPPNFHVSVHAVSPWELS